MSRGHFVKINIFEEILLTIANDEFVAEDGCVKGDMNRKVVNQRRRVIGGVGRMKEYKCVYCAGC